MKDNLKFTEIDQQLKTLSDRKMADLTWLLFGWMSNEEANSEEYIKAMTDLLNNDFFKENQNGCNL